MLTFVSHRKFLRYYHTRTKLKICPKCLISKELTEYFKDTSRKSGLKSYCKPCHYKVKNEWQKLNRDKCNEYAKRHYTKYPDKIRKCSRQAAWNHQGIFNADGTRFTESDFEVLLASQSGKCKICNEIPTKGLAVDHNHGTGIVRGLLCRNCNAGIGLLKESKAALSSAIEYLV